MDRRTAQLVIVVMLCLLAAILGKVWSIEAAVEAAAMSCSR